MVLFVLWPYPWTGWCALQLFFLVHFFFRRPSRTRSFVWAAAAALHEYSAGAGGGKIQPGGEAEEGTRDASMSGWKPPVYARAGNVGRGAQRQNERVNTDTARMQQLSANAYDDSINYKNSLRIKEAMRGKAPPTDPTMPRFGDSWQGSALGSMSKEIAGIAPPTPGESWQVKETYYHYLGIKRDLIHRQKRPAIVTSVSKET